MARRESTEIVLKPEVGKFYQDYTREFARVSDLYYGDPASIDKYVEVSSDPYLRMIKRPKLHQTLHDYNQSLGAPAAVMETVDRLRYDGAYCVLAWQQPYLLGGPLETFLKCVTAIKTCERLNATGAAKFVPVLWAHLDDHDLREVNRVKVPAGARLVEERLDVDESERPSESVETGEAYDALLARVRRHLADTPHTAWLFEALAACKGANLGDHFDRLMMRLFGEHGLVLACPRIFRTEIAAMLGRAIENPERIDRLLSGQKKAIEEKGYACHTKWEDPLHLYRLSEGHPLRLRYNGGKFVLDQTGGEMTPAQVANEVKRWPQIYTNGVLLSPLVQDSCLPSVAHVAGPAGIEFFGVLKPLFDSFNVCYPQIIPQVSASLVDARAAAGLKALGKGVEGLIADARAAAAAGGDVPVDHGAALAQLRDGVQKALEGYSARCGEVAAASSKVAGEVADAVARELGRLVQATAVGPAREAVLAALKRFEERALSVSPSAGTALAEARRRLEAEVKDRFEPAKLAEARTGLERASAALVEAARAGAEALPKGFAGALGRSLDDTARAAIEAQAREAATTVSPADLAKLLLAPEGGLQEDTIAMIYFLNERGPGLVAEVAAAIDPFDFRHQVVYLE